MSEIVAKKESWTEEQIQTIKNTVAVGASNDELKMFLSISAKYDLDPFLHEIWFANMGNRNVIMTGRDGHLKIANRNPNLPFNEYNKGGRGVWGQYPTAMILKVAESMALKRAFSISGLVTEEELGGEEESRENLSIEAENKRKQIIRQLWNR